ncbi:MAG: TIGR03862 family flavoprotein [Caulobacteraceae bacterium]|nr:TIGR03862 family flavoprotein [Caulobacteraceae bacterium]
MADPRPQSRLSAAVVGGGPAGLIAAETLAAAGWSVTVFERMPSAGRKFLMAGRGGLNLTHAEPLPAFLGRYGAGGARLREIVEAFPPAALRDWADGLGAETFTGSSGRVFPRAMKASPLLRAWLSRLEGLGVSIRTRTAWTGWSEDGALRFEGESGVETLRPAATVLALGGASWPRLGSDGRWVDLLAARGVEIAPFRPSNAGLEIDWSEPFRQRFAGQPLKAVALSFGERVVRGEAVVAGYGLEGGAVYALSGPLRDALAADGRAELTLDLAPDVTVETLTERLSRGRAGDPLSNRLRKAGLSPVAVGLMREARGVALPPEPARLARVAKGARLRVNGMRGLERAISSAGGVAWDAVDDQLMLRRLPGVFVAGEMLDWEAPTGGYLLQACFASGLAAARGVLAREASV